MEDFGSPTFMFQLVVQTFERKYSKENIRKKHSNPTYLGWKKWRRCVAKIKSRIKGHHWDKCKYTIGEKLRCITETGNKHSNHVVSVNTK